LSHQGWIALVAALAAGAAFHDAAHAMETPAPALAEIEHINTLFAVPIEHIRRAPGVHQLGASDSFTAASLAGLSLQPNPPELGTVPAYRPEQQDVVTAPPYVSTGLQNFRFDYFHNVYNFSGWHTWPSADYASVHGFQVLSNYGRDTPNVTWLPAGTQWLASFGYVNWDTFMGVLGLPAGRWDQLVDLGETQIVQAILGASSFSTADPAKVDELMIDMEHVALDPPTLRQQPWYPAADSDVARVAFEKKYYDGFALSQYAPVEAAKQLGFRHVSLYGWKPIRVGWVGLDTYDADPATDWFWQSVGVQVMQHVDSVNNSVYCFYWSAQNVAYTLAQNDLNLKYIRSLSSAERKPMRPYFWNQLHGGGPGWRWWRDQSLPTEEMRALMVLNAFTQYDGMVLWNWSATGDPNLPPPLAAERDVMLKDDTFAAADDLGASRTFARYDALHITSVDDGGNLRFQLIDKSAPPSSAGVGPAFAYYNSTVAALTPHLRAPSESLAAMFEGLAMAKLVEWSLRHGEQVADFDPQQVYANTAPILRHIRNGDLHLIATYDPQVVYGRPARSIAVDDFAGVAGLRLTFCADAEVRMYIIRLRDPD
jgi:hypothetical protein